VAKGADRLASLLGADLPEDVRTLPDAVLDRLAGQIERARQEQDRLIAEAVDSAIRGVPLPVRGIVRKTLRG
jgi:hypothetical protein